MPHRRMAGAVLIVSLVLAVAGIASVLTFGPDRPVIHRYSSRHTFTSSVLGICVETTARGTATGRRIGWGPFVRWTDVHLTDPSITATGYALAAGRCDPARRVDLAATLQQTWTGSSGPSSSRRSDEGPASRTLTQFNSGAPVHLPDRAFPASPLDAGYAMHGEFLIDARVLSGSEGFGYRTTFTLRADAD